MNKITLKVWATDRRTLAKIAAGEFDFKGINGGVAYSNADMTTANWTEVGLATCDVRIMLPKDIIGTQVKAIRKEINRINAEAGKRTTELQGEINKLLAIENGVTP